MRASVRALQAPQEARQVACDGAAELAKRELLWADPDPSARGLVAGLDARQRRQLLERHVERAAADADADDLDGKPGIADARDPGVVEALLEQRSEPVGREAEVVARVLVDPEEHHRADDRHATLGRADARELAARLRRVGAMLEGVEAQRGPHAAVLEAQRAQVLDLVDPRAGAHVGAGERPPGEDRAQVPHPGAGIRLEGAELHDGVGADPAYAARARERLDQVVEADLETLDPAPLGRFDVLVAGDVLEHLQDPWTVLRRFAELVEPGGAVVVSLPNVRHWETVFAIAVQGRFPRRNEGVFDATHLRWFTLHDAWSLVEQAGLEVEEGERRIRYRGAGGAKETPTARLIARVPGPRAFLTYQHIIRARKLTSSERT